MRRLALLSIILNVSVVCAGEEAKLDLKALKGQVKSSIESGITFLRTQQNKDDGSYGPQRDVGVTALVLSAIVNSPAKYRPADGPFVRKAVEFLLDNVAEDGSIRNKKDPSLANYKTCASILALVSIEDPKLKPIIEKARKYIIGAQCSEDSGYDSEKDKNAYGGFGYGGGQRPDLSNTQFALSALKAAGLEESDPAFKRVVAFLNRCQNLSETNDMPTAGNDGGGFYSPVESKADKVKLPNGKEIYRSYGSMTYALLRCFLLAGIPKDDPRVKAAHAWLRDHYTLDENPEMGNQGLYYYYLTMAEALKLYGDPYIVTKDGQQHHWAAELAQKLVSLQKSGSWANNTGRFWEDDKTLCTAYAVLTLDICYDLLDKPGK